MNNKPEPLWNNDELSEVLNINISGNWQFNGIEIDSRKIKDGRLFFAFEGKNFNGHDFIKDALNSGAKGVVVNRNVYEKFDGYLILRVKDVYAAMLKLAKASRKRTNNSNIIAITGSSGKTSTKEMLKSALINIGNVHASPDSYNNYMGVPYSLINMPKDTKFGIFEIGMNHSNEIRPLSKLVNPSTVIITNITDAHIGNFKSLNDIVKAKSEIFEGLNKDGQVIINRDFSSYDKTINIANKLGIKNIFSYGVHENSDIRLIDRVQLPKGQKIEAEAFGKKYLYKINFNGKHQAINSLSVLSILILLKQDIRKGLNSLFSAYLPMGRGNKYIFSMRQGKIVLIDDTYNANPSSVKASINLLNETAKNNRKVVILGEMAELGKHSESLHLALKECLLENDIDMIVFVGNKTKGLYNALKRNIKCFWNKDSKTVIYEKFINLILPNDFILVKGSRSVKMEIIVDYIKENFSLEEKK